MPETLKVRGKEIDLVKLKADYVLNIFTFPELSRRHGINIKNLARVVDQYGWEEDLVAGGKKPMDYFRSYAPVSSNYFWTQVEAEFVSQDITLEMLAKKHGVSVRSINEKALEGKWQENKDKLVERTREMGQKALFWKTEEFALRGSGFMDATTEVAVTMMEAVKDVIKKKGMTRQEIKEVTSTLKDLVPMGLELFGLKNEGTGENKPTLIRLELMNSATHEKISNPEKVIDIKAT